MIPVRFVGAAPAQADARIRPRPASAAEVSDLGCVLYADATGGFTGFAGVEAEPTLTPEAAETLGRRIGAAVARPGVGSVSVEIPLGAEAAAALGEGLILRAEPLPALRSKPSDDDARPDALVILARDPDRAAALWTRRAPVVEATLWARGLVHLPANRLGPAELEAEAQSLAAQGVSVTSLAGGALDAAGLGLIAAVGRGAARPPRLVILEWPGADPAAPPLALVGKGIVFDTGGISIKPAAGMEEMKGDMGGAAAVLGALKVAAAWNSPLRVVGLLAIAENAVGGAATRPGDVVAACDGTTVEIVDTDAEGRLVLADALAYAARAFSPFLSVDLATLTGAVVRSLGRWRAGLFSTGDAAAARLTRAADAAREPVWRLPLMRAGDDALDSPVADLKNCAWGTVPDAIHAASFLSRFAGAGAWAHLDIAGTAEAPATTDRDRRGPRGWGVRLLAELIADLETEPWTSSRP